MAVFRKEKQLGLEYVKQFTSAYKKGTKQNKFRREALCQKVQFPAVLMPPLPEDLLCGRRTFPEVGYSPQYGGLGYYWKPDSWPDKKEMDNLPSTERVQWEELARFWEEENTESKCWNTFDDQIRQRMPLAFTGEQMSAPAYPLYRMSGLQPDYAKLVKGGLPGLTEEVQRYTQSTEGHESREFYTAALASINTVQDCLTHYAQLLSKSSSVSSEQLKENLEHLKRAAPETFYQALQLILLVQCISGTLNFGRLDVSLGPFLKADLDSGRITWERAKELLSSFYVIIESEILHWDGRITVGGKGRQDEAAADLFAALAIETIDAVNLPMPQLSLRFHKNQNPELLDAGFDVIGKGKTFPMLYNDDVNVSAVQKAFRVSLEDAEQYAPFGCGEYIINHKSSGTPNFIINLQMCLELALNGGKSLVTGRQWAPDFGDLSGYTSIEDVRKAYEQTVEYFLKPGARGQRVIYEVTGAECPFSLLSILYDDCMESGRPLFSGGAAYLGGTNETYGNTNTADSLTALKKLVYEERRYSPKQVLQALRSDWKDSEQMRREFVSAPKYGNDDSQADETLAYVHNHISLATAAQAAPNRLHHFLVVVINNSANTTWGITTGAGADGRRSGAPFAPGNAPAAGADKNGLTAVLNSQAKPDPSIHAGAVQNVRIAAQLPLQKPDLYKALFRGYFSAGGAQCMISVTSKEDLEDALVHPENHQNLMVRVGGFSARFVDLEKDVQREVLSRTEHVM